MGKQKRIKFKNRTPEHKDKHFFSRFNPKFRRRREGKTDYRHRRKILTQDKSEYNSRKYRLVIRRTTRYITAQLIYYEATGDKVFCSASSKELIKFGLETGLSSYAAAYCVGLLIATRYKELISKSVEKTDDKLIDKEDREEVDGEGEDSDDDFAEIVVDLGLARVTTGCRVLGVLKGAVDGDMDIAFNERRFPGSSYDEDSGEWVYDPEKNRKCIMGCRNKVAQMEGEEKAAALFKAVHDRVRENPFSSGEENGYKYDKMKKSGNRKKKRAEKRERKLLKKAGRESKRVERKTNFQKRVEKEGVVV